MKAKKHIARTTIVALGLAALLALPVWAQEVLLAGRGARNAILLNSVTE